MPRELHEFNGEGVVVGCGESYCNNDNSHYHHNKNQEFYTVDLMDDCMPDLRHDLRTPFPEGFNGRFNLTLLEFMDSFAYSANKPRNIFDPTRHEPASIAPGLKNAFTITKEDGFILIMGCPAVAFYRRWPAHIKYCEIKMTQGHDLDTCVLIPKNQAWSLEEMKAAIRRDVFLSTTLNYFFSEYFLDKEEFKFSDTPYAALLDFDRRDKSFATNFYTKVDSSYQNLSTAIINLELLYPHNDNAENIEEARRITRNLQTELSDFYENYPKNPPASAAKLALFKKNFENLLYPENPNNKIWNQLVTAVVTCIAELVFSILGRDLSPGFFKARTLNQIKREAQVFTDLTEEYQLSMRRAP